MGGGARAGTHRPSGEGAAGPSALPPLPTLLGFGSWGTGGKIGAHYLSHLVSVCLSSTNGL